MSSNSSPKPKAAKAITVVAMYLGIGLGFTGELVGSAWLGWWIGKWWITQGGSKQSPGLGAASLVVLALVHVIWLLIRISNRQEQSQAGTGKEP